jgi:tetratricopeptide (TPR) repeat protein
VLRDLVKQRLQALPPAALSILETAAIIGREMDEGLLLAAHGSTERPASESVDELIGRQILERSGDDGLRFVHDKLREVTYDNIPAGRLRPLHGAVAEAILRRYGDHPDLPSFWPRLGDHFRLAGVADRAFDFLAKAGDHARARNANDDAISLYRSAVEQLDTCILTGEDVPDEWRGRAIELRESAADLLALTGRREEARGEYQAALDRLAAAQALARSRIIRKIGKTWETQQQQDAALRHYDLALATLGTEPAGELRDAWQEELVQIRSDQIFANYWLGQVPAMESLVSALKDTISAGHSSPRQRVRLHRAEMHLCFRRDRYAISQDGVEHARAGLNECLSIGDLADLPIAHFNFAFALFLCNDFEAADWELRSALAIADRAGDVAHQARCLTYLAVNARRSGRLEAARLFLPRCYSVAGAAGTKEYMGAARAHDAWLAYTDSDLVGSEAKAREALSIWNGLTIVFPFQWTALFPLIQVELLRDDIGGAAQSAHTLLTSPQQKLPLQVEASLRQACQRLELGDLSNARRAFADSISQASQFKFL